MHPNHISKCARERGFTLIELLVVISIISMLSSVVLVSLSSARDKGRIGAGLTFATHTYRAFGIDAAVYSDFSSNTFDNIAWNGTTISSVGSPTIVADSPSGQGNSLRLPGSSGVRGVLPAAPPSGQFSRFTASMWVKPGAASDGGFLLNTSTNSACTDPNTRLASIYWNSGNQSLSIAVGNAALAGNQWNSITGSINEVARDRWTHVAYSYDGSKYTLYINGRKVDTNTTMPSPTSPVDATAIRCYTIGYLPVSGFEGYFEGNIDDVGIFPQSLTSNDVQQIYAAGLPRRVISSTR